MRNDECASVLPLLPEWIRGEAGDDEGRRVEAHVAGCADCAAEAELLRALRASRPEPPAELAARIKGGLRAAEARPGASPGWIPWEWSALVPRLAAVAAVLVLAASVLLLPGEDGGDGAGDLGIELALDQVPEVWLSEDGMVAGAPLLSDLTEEEMESLLEEMEP